MSSLTNLTLTDGITVTLHWASLGTIHILRKHFYGMGGGVIKVNKYLLLLLVYNTTFTLA